MNPRHKHFIIKQEQCQEKTMLLIMCKFVTDHEKETCLLQFHVHSQVSAMGLNIWHFIFVTRAAVGFFSGHSRFLDTVIAYTQQSASYLLIFLFLTAANWMLIFFFLFFLSDCRLHVSKSHRASCRDVTSMPCLLNFASFPALSMPPAILCGIPTF